MIVYDKGQNEHIIYGMWERNFHDPIPYARFYFETVYPKNQVILWQEGEVMKGMIHWNAYTQYFLEEKVPATYIVGVATDEEYRREGVMRKLLGETFRELREKGQTFTYLMPADKEYYLPFGFRYGMSQIEQELYIEGTAPLLKEGWSFTEIPEGTVELERIAEQENAVRKQQFAMHTGITADYLKQMNQEAKGDFARMLFVYKDSRYVGRCVMGTEDSYMTLSQLNCVDLEKKTEWIEQLIAYGENRYHYGAYKLIADSSWEESLKELGTKTTWRMLPMKKVPIIMFRILDIEKFAQKIQSKKEQEIQIYIADINLPVQSGRYIWKATPEGCSLRKYNGEDIADGGKIQIGDVTDVLFSGGEKQQNIDEMQGLTEVGKAFMKNLIPIGEVCITEIV